MRDQETDESVSTEGSLLRSTFSTALLTRGEAVTAKKVRRRTVRARVSLCEVCLVREQVCERSPGAGTNLELDSRMRVSPSPYDRAYVPPPPSNP